MEAAPAIGCIAMVLAVIWDIVFIGFEDWEEL